MSGGDVIIALDFPSAEAVYAFLDKFENEARKPYVKVGMELFYAEGPQIVREIKARGHKIFLDLKLHDIPNTVKKAMASLSRLDVDMTNLHAAGTIDMMRAAVEGLTRPRRHAAHAAGRDAAHLHQRGAHAARAAHPGQHARHRQEVRPERQGSRTGRRGVLAAGGGAGEGGLRRGVPDGDAGHPLRGFGGGRPGRA